MESRDRQILEKIIMYCDRLEENKERISGNKEIFLVDHMVQDACCMCIVQIGELAGLLTEKTKSLNNSIPWRVIKDTRNFYVHSYGSIDLDMVWNTMASDVPLLKDACVNMVGQIDENDRFLQKTALPDNSDRAEKFGVQIRPSPLILI